MQPNMDREQILKEAIDSIFEMDRKIYEASSAQKEMHLAIARIKNPGDDVLKKSKEADRVISNMKTERQFFADILFKTTGAFVVPIWDE